jgi:hypothetical protein
VDELVEGIVEMERRVEKNREGERLHVSAQEAFWGGEYKRAFEESTVAARCVACVVRFGFDCRRGMCALGWVCGQRMVRNESFALSIK